MLPKVHQELEELWGVGEVEVACHHQRAGFPVVGPYLRVDVVYGPVSVGAVAQMPQEQLAGKGQVGLAPFHIGQQLGRYPFHVPVDLGKHVFDGCG